MSSAADSSAAGIAVTAVVVAHDGAAWLPRLLSALARSTRVPDVLIGVDTGSTDDSADLLREAFGVENVLTVDRRTGFGAAIAAGVAKCDAASDPGPPASQGARGRHAAPRVDAEKWVWLLHDDCAPGPDALERLLETGVADSRVAAVGCRVRAWPQARRLLEVGVTITGTGHRETGLEPGEHDQGQYDEERDVLAVSSAGMLVRRSVWDVLGGLDPRLPLFRDDVDFGWRAAAAGYRVVVAPRAVLFHAEASSRGVRDISSTVRRPHQADRRAAIFTLLANCRSAALPFLFLRLLAGSLMRAFGYLVGKLPAAAWDEVAAAAAVLGRPWRLFSARRWRRRTRGGPAVAVRHLLPRWWTPYATALDVVLVRLSESFRQAASSLASSSRTLRSGRADPQRLETGPVPDEAVALPRGEGPLAQVARHPLLALTAVLSVAGVAASRGLWGAGFLQGGALWPAPAGVGDWWGLYLEDVHQVGLGSSLEPAPYVALLAVPATLLIGKAWLAVDLLMLFAAPLAGIGAWAAAGRLVRGLGARVWMAAAYGLVPVVTGAATSGHVGTVAFVLLLPWVARGGCRILDLGVEPRWGTAWATGLTLSVATAFAPACWPIALGVGVVAMCWLLAKRQWRRGAQWALAVSLPVGLLLPWSWRVLSRPALALTEAGAVDVPGVSVSGSAWQLAFFRVDAAGQAPWWLTGGVTVVALVALVRSDTRPRVAAAWLVVAAGLTAAAVMGRDVLTPPLGAGQAYPWLGVPVVVAAAGLIAAGGLAADGLRLAVGSGSFGWRQPLAATAVVVGISAPLLGLAWWVGAAAPGALHRGVAVPVPAYMADAMTSSDARVLVLRTGTPTVRYDVLAGDGERLGDDSVLPAAGAPRLSRLVADVLSESRPADISQLATLGIRYVVLPSPQSPTAVARLDGAAGLTRTSTEQAVLSGWEIDETVVSGPTSQAAGPRSRWVVVQAVGWLLVVVLATPGVRRRPLQAPEQAS